MNYLIWLTIFMVIPLVLLIAAIMRYKPKLITDNLDVIGISMMVLLIIGYVWDAYAIYEGWWYYESHQIVGLWILGMPLEEYLFILTTSLFYVLLTLIALDRWDKK